MATDTEKKDDKPKGAIRDLPDRVSSIFVSKKGLTREQAKTLNKHILEIAHKAGVDVAGYNVYKSEMDAVLHMIADEGMIGEARADRSGLKGVKAIVVKDGVSKEDLDKNDYLKVLAATVVTAIVEKSGDLTEKQKTTAVGNVYDEVRPICDLNSEWKGFYQKCTDETKIKAATNPTCRGYVTDKVVRTGLGVLSFSGLVASVKAIFNPKDNGERPSFWEQVGNIAKAAGFAFVMYNMAYKGRGVGETIDNTRQAIGKFTGMENARREKAHALTFEPRSV